MQRGLYLHTLILLSCELVRADGSHGDVGPHQFLVLLEEGEGVHAAEGGADHHGGDQVQALTHFFQESCGGQFPNRSRGHSRARLAQSCGR